MSIEFASLCPHPPIIIPGVGNEKDREKVSKTIESMNRLAADLKEKEIETVVIVSSHINHSEKFIIKTDNGFTSSLPGALLTYKGDPELAGKISSLKDAKPLKGGDLDHGTAVPLHFFKQKKPNIKVVPVGTTSLSIENHFLFGKKLGKLLSEEKKKIALIASGDLSHRLTPSAPSGFSEEGEKFDKKFLTLIRGKKITELDEKMIEKAAPCGCRSAAILTGSISTKNYNPEIVSYEGPFGVGYAVIEFKLKNNED